MNSISSILKNMRQHLRIYFLAKAIDKVSAKASKDHLIKPHTAYVIEEYKKWHPLTNERKFRIVLGQAVEWKYVKESLDRYENSQIKVKNLQLLDKGWRIIDTYPLIPIPSGLFQVWWDEDSIAVKLLIVLFFGGAGTAITHFMVNLIKTVINHYHL